MAFGIADIISLVMGLNGFGLQPNPKAPTVDAALEYALPDADVVVHIDAASFVPNNFKALTQLPELPAIKASPELASAVSAAVAQVTQLRTMASAMAGIDIVDDIADATAFFQIVPNQPPMFVIEVHGKFTSETMAKLGMLAGQPPTAVGSGQLTEKGTEAVGLTKDKVLLIGGGKLVRDRLAESWRPPQHGGGVLASAAEALAGKPVFAFAIALSPAARQLVAPQLAPVPTLADMVARFKGAWFAVYHDGMGWSWTDSTKDGFESFAMMSDGLIDLMRAVQVAPRGVAKIALGALTSYQSDPRIAELLKHKDDVLKVVASFSGDGQFKVKTDKDTKALKLTVRASAKSLSEVVPIGMIAPLAAIGAVFALTEKASASPPAPAVIVAPTKAPAAKPAMPAKPAPTPAPKH
jgi:hypothetical protein